MDTNNPTPPSTLRTAYRDMLADIHDWRTARRAANIRFYSEAIATGRVRIEGKDHTTRKANCDCCLLPQAPGIRKLFLAGPGCHHFHICEKCMPELIEAAPLDELLAVQTA